jgi:hypothetical protein
MYSTCIEFWTEPNQTNPDLFQNTVFYYSQLFELMLTIGLSSVQINKKIK